MTKRKRLPKRMWVSRDSAEGSDYVLWSVKPVLNKLGWYEEPDASDCYRLGIFCSDPFETYTGFTLKLGECKRRRVILEES